MNNVLLVIDMQNDFVDGALGTKEAQAIVPAVISRIKKAKEDKEEIYFTRDCHFDDYLETQEGRNLPVKHCISGTEGFELIPEVKELAAGKMVVDKPGFGSVNLAGLLKGVHQFNPIDQITLIGLCTDICVICNAMLLKAALPEIPLVVEQSCCAGVTPESHENALKAMAMCQIKIV